MSAPVEALAACDHAQVPRSDGPLPLENEVVTLRKEVRDFCNVPRGTRIRRTSMVELVMVRVNKTCNESGQALPRLDRENVHADGTFPWLPADRTDRPVCSGLNSRKGCMHVVLKS